MKRRSISALLSGLLCVIVLLNLLSVSAFAIGSPPSQAGKKVLSGGQRDFAFPVPGHNMLSSCFYDNRNHCALDFPAPKGTAIVASYAGTVEATYNGCSHNYGKSRSCGCGSGFGNYVILKHDYVLKSGEHITLYSSYNHLTKATVYEGQTVKKGQQVGTMGSTGYSTGHHLDYQILMGGYSPFRSYSIDPYINELLELPEGLHSMNSGGCCSRYVAYVKEYYPRCQHESFNASGNCSECGYTFDFSSTRSADAMGIYSVKSDITSAAKPYAASLGSGGKTLAAGKEISVSASVTNGAGERWYELKDGSYVPKSALTFVTYLESEFKGEITSPKEEQVLKQQSHTLSGSVSSLYPLRKVSGYLDGKCYATWTSSGMDTSLRLSSTDINNKLYFSKLAPGKHTLTITATDLTGREETKVTERIFYIEQPSVFHTVKLSLDGGSCETEMLSIQEGKALEAMPTPEKEGYSFDGWYLESGEAATENTVVKKSITLIAHWKPTEHTVLFGETEVLVTHGQTLETLPELTQEGYTFLGWYTAEEGGTRFTLETSVTEDTTLYPQWKALQYKLTLDPGEGKIIWRNKNVTYGQNYGIIPEPKLEGHRFIGWSIGNSLVTKATTVTTAKSHTLTAVWEVIETLPAATEPNVTDAAKDYPLWIFIACPVLLVGAAVAFVLVLRKKQPATMAEPVAEEAPTEEFTVEEIIAEVTAAKMTAEEVIAEETACEETITEEPVLQ